MSAPLALDNGLVLQDNLAATVAAAALPDGRSEFLYALVPHEGGFRVMRVRMSDFLKIAEPVSDVNADPQPAAAKLEVAVPQASSSRRLSGGLTGQSARKGGSTGKPAITSYTPSRKPVSLDVRPTEIISFGDVQVNVSTRTARKAGYVVPLAPLELDLLIALHSRDGAAVSRDELLIEIWGFKDGVTPRTVDTHIFNLRRKLEDRASRPRHILTVNKIGYRLRI